MSLTVFPGMKAQFQCIGSGDYLSWEVDGLSVHDATVKKRGITAVTVSFSSTVQSNLTVPATSVNNGTTVRCAISASSVTVISNYSTLVVLSGTSHIPHLVHGVAINTMVLQHHMHIPAPCTMISLHHAYHHACLSYPSLSACINRFCS